MKKDLQFVRLFDLYAPLLTNTQREITDLYFNFDLSLGEIAEQKGVSRQSVSDCLRKCKKQLETYEEWLHYAAYEEAVEDYIAKQKAGEGNILELELALQAVRKDL